MPQTILDLLDKWAFERGNTKAYIFLNSSGEEEDSISFFELRDRSLRVARALHERSLENERVVLSLTPGLNFITAFLGCLYAKAIAVPMPIPRNKRQLLRCIPVLEDAKPALIISDQSLDLPYLTLKLDQLQKEEGDLPLVYKTTIAFLQYTSGSTSLPKGVVLTHEHLFYHQQVLTTAFQHDENTIIGGWLPFYHDMGLIGNILNSLYLGVTSVLMAPATFIQKPLIWLQTISRYKITTSGGPNFAYQHCLKIDDAALSALDLSSWTVAFNGSERVGFDTLNAFSKKFQKAGFNSKSIFPCYGLAEATLFVTGGKQVKECSGAVSCGKTFLNDEVQIVDPETKIGVTDGRQGEIWVKSPSVALGYWGKPKETEEIFKAYTHNQEGPYLRTGDLGFKQDNELYILGRIKNLIVIRGKNYFPFDLEECVKKSDPALEDSQGIVFSILKEGVETLVVVQEINRNIKDQSLIDQLFLRIRESLAETFEIVPSNILFVKPNSLPRTTSGKFQYGLAKEQYLRKELSVTHFWQQEGGQTNEASDNLHTALAKLLGVAQESIDPSEPILRYGVDSLVGMQFLHWIENRYGKTVELEMLLKGATLNEIESTLASIEPIFRENQLPRSAFPLSWNQENVMTYEKLHPDSLAYHIFFAIRLKGVLDLDRLREALEAVVKRQPALRSQFSATGQTIVQSIEIPLGVSDISEEQIFERIKEASQRKFDLKSSPLFRIELLRVHREDSIMVCQFHHLICDGWSIGLFFKDLEAAYQHQPLKELVQFYDQYVEEQGRYDFQTLDPIFERRLKSEEYPILSLSPFRSLESGAGLIKTEIDQSVMEKIKLFAKTYNITPTVVLMAAFHGLLHLYSGENTVYVGYPSANRKKGQLDLIGFFVNTLVSKTNTESGSFLELLNQVKETLWQGGESSAYPLQRLLERLRPPRFPNTSPLFQVLFVMQNAPVTLTQFSDLQVEQVEVGPNTPLYDLVFEVQESQSGLKLLIEYQRDKLDDATAERLKSSYLLLLESCLKDPQLPIDTHPLESEPDLLYLFEHQVKKQGHKAAMVSDGKTLSYIQLQQLIDAIGQHLLEVGIHVGDRVAVSLPRSPELIASLFAILKVGAVYVPIDPTYPQSKIDAIMEDAGCRYCISNSMELKATRSFGFKPFPKVEKDKPAYILYTSGSTGKPKGVEVSRKSLHHFILSAIELFEVDEKDRVLQFSSISWDTSSEEIYPCLFSGATLVLRGSESIESYSDLLERSVKHQVSIWDLPSSYWNDLVETLERRKLSLPSSLRLVIVGGEKVNHAKVKLWTHEIGANVKLLNTYGATEATSISAAHDLSHWKEAWIDTPIGKALPHVKLYILNRALVEVMPGIVGNLYIGGSSLANGYLNQSQLTDEKFIQHPKYGRLYNTNDCAYKTSSGEILLRGRKDRQIKRRGFRIELEEIENALLKIEGVSACCVLFDKVLSAYIVRVATLSLEQVRTDLRSRLPEYLIPDYFHFVIEIPRLPNGKIDMVTLKAIPNEKAKADLQLLTPNEEKVYALWKAVLKTEQIDKDDNFFDVGGNSLLLIQLHDRLQEAFEVTFNVSLLFSNFSIASQAQKMDEIGKRKSPRNKLSKIDLLKKLEEGAITASEAQELLKNEVK